MYGGGTAWYSRPTLISPSPSSLLSRVISFQKLKVVVPLKFQLDPLDIVLRSPKIAKFLNLEW